VSLVVLDAAAAVEVFLGTPEGRRPSAKIPKASTSHVPEHFYVEVAAVLRRMELGGAISADNAGKAYRRLLALTAIRAQVRPLLPGAWALRHSLTVADAIYVVLARKLGATLVTADKRLGRAPNLGISVIS
jgi:predicted nucleic acid-binding protein